MLRQSIVLLHYNSRIFLSKFDIMGLLEDSGFSYSGISDIIHDQGKTKELLFDIEKTYQEAKQKQEQLEKELLSIKAERCSCVMAYIHAWKALELGNKPLSFIDVYGNLVVVNVTDYENCKIDHEIIPITANNHL